MTTELLKGFMLNSMETNQKKKSEKAKEKVAS